MADDESPTTQPAGEAAAGRTRASAARGAPSPSPLRSPTPTRTLADDLDGGLARADPGPPTPTPSNGAASGAVSGAPPTGVTAAAAPGAARVAGGALATGRSSAAATASPAAPPPGGPAPPAPVPPGGAAGAPPASPRIPTASRHDPLSAAGAGAAAPAGAAIPAPLPPDLADPSRDEQDLRHLLDASRLGAASLLESPAGRGMPRRGRGRPPGSGANLANPPRARAAAPPGRATPAPVPARAPAHAPVARSNQTVIEDAWARGQDHWMADDFEDEYIPDDAPDAQDLVIIDLDQTPRPPAPTHPGYSAARLPMAYPRAAQPLAPPPTANIASVGLFRAASQAAPAGLELVLIPTAQELQSISAEAVHYLFDPRRVAEITRPRTTADDIKAAAFLKAQKALETRGWNHVAADSEFHNIFFGCQVVFRAGMSPSTIALLLSYCIPFGLDVPNDISKGQEWSALTSLACSLYPQLEAEVHACRVNNREYNMPASLFSRIRACAEAHTRLLAEALFPLLAFLGTSPLHEQCKAVIRGYIAQASGLSAAWGYVETMIDAGMLRSHGVDPAQAENAARVTIARAFLIARLQGQQRNWDMTATLQSHITFQPSATLLHSTDFGKLILTNPAAASLAATLTRSFPPFNLPTPSVPPDLPYPGPALPAPTQSLTSTLSPLDTQRGFRISVGGARVHPLYFSGEYVPPPDWLPPPAAGPGNGPSTGAGPGPAPALGNANRVQRPSPLTVPTSKSIVASSSPFVTASPHPCDYCNVTAHAQYECPRRFADTFHAPLPGFTMSGDYDRSAWLNGDLTPPARAAMAAFLTGHKIPTHRRFGVTPAHIASGVAPAPPQA